MTKVMIAVCLGALTLAAQNAKITPMLTKELAEMPGKEASMVTVEYAQGGSSAAHRHKCSCVRLRARRDGSHAAERRWGSDTRTGPDVL